MRPRFAVLSRTRYLVRAAAALILSVCAVPAAYASDWDIVGIKLGMTEAEVTAAFKAYDPKGQINIRNSNYSYTDKVNRFRTPAFLSSMELRVTGISMNTPLQVWFSGPDGEVKAIAVTRQEINLPNPTTAAQFTQSIYAKYGEPTHLGSNGTPIWQEAGKPSCITRQDGILSERIDLQAFPQIVTGHKTVEQAVQQLEADQQRPEEQSLPADLGTCGAFMFYLAGGEAVTSFRAGIFDVGAIMDTHRRRMAWVEQLEAEAIRKRESQGQGPRL